MSFDSIDYSTVLSVLHATLSTNNVDRLHAETSLKEWERNVQPGFLGNLLKVATETTNILEV